MLVILFFAVLVSCSCSLRAPWWTEIKSKVTIEEMDVGNVLICIAENASLRLVIDIKQLLWEAQNCFKQYGIIQEKFGKNKMSLIRNILKIIPKIKKKELHSSFED